ncbi:MAG: response regulator, partial [Campylobacterales bacterium]
MESSKKTILVVDDTESNIDMLLAILKDYDVIPALSGEDALEIAKEEVIDLALLDIMMPKMDGYEVCRELKRDPLTAEIPI